MTSFLEVASAERLYWLAGVMEEHIEMDVVKEWLLYRQVGTFYFLVSFVVLI